MILPKVSVIVPVYNVENYLAKCLDSILAQKFTDFELIVVNDGSTDNSLEIALEYQGKDNRIFVLDKNNGGLSDARNFGLDIAKGEYIAFIDSDDTIEPNMLSEMYEEAEENQSDIVFCALNKVNERGNINAFLSQGDFETKRIVLEKDFSIFGEFSCFACNKLFKSSLFDENRFTKMHFEDIELIPKLVLMSKKISILNKAFYNYLEREGSITKNHTIKGLNLLDAVRRVSEFYGKTSFKPNQTELKRFQILQGFYSFLAYVAFVKDARVKGKMLNELLTFITENNISRIEILKYKRFGKFYLLTLDYKKQFYYLLAIIHPRILGAINL